eukprot:4126734-Amphidinium_carterae.1
MTVWPTKFTPRDLVDKSKFTPMCIVLFFRAAFKCHCVLPALLREELMTSSRLARDLPPNIYISASILNLQ